jgi:pimeloyl-ACP methyl ester carboxylesterase
MKQLSKLMLIASVLLAAFHIINGFTRSFPQSTAALSRSSSSSCCFVHNMLPPNLLSGIDDATTLLTRSQAITYPLGFLAAFRTGAAVSVINQPQMPQVNAAVGSTVIRLPTYGTRVRLFYPTTSSSTSNAVMAPYCTDGRQTSDGIARLVKFDALGLSFLLAHLANASSGCVADGPIDNTNSLGGDEEHLPLLVYSHGYGGNMDMGTYFFRTMASKGMIVAAVEHTDGTASSTVLPDGTERRFNEYFMTGRQQLTRRASELLEAVEFLPKELERIYMTTVGTIMLAGHSYGAPSAIMAANGASEDSNIAGLILHDPALGMGYGMLPPNGAKSKIPSITYTSDEYNRAKVRYGDLTLHVKGAYHGNFVDAPLWAPSVVMRSLSLLIPAAGPSNPVEVHEQLAQSAAEFIRSKNPASPNVMAGKLFEFVA